jgi:hypothetical protein
VRSKEEEWRRRGGVRLSDAPGSMADDVDLTEAIEGIPLEFQKGLTTVLLHVVHVSIAKKRMVLMKLHGPVYREEKISSYVKLQD